MPLDSDASAGHCLTLSSLQPNAPPAPPAGGGRRNQPSHGRVAFERSAEKVTNLSLLPGLLHLGGKVLLLRGDGLLPSEILSSSLAVPRAAWRHSSAPDPHTRPRSSSRSSPACSWRACPAGRYRGAGQAPIRFSASVPPPSDATQ